MHRPARRPLARESLVHPHLPAKETPAPLRRGWLSANDIYLLVVEQVLEIILTFFTLNVDGDPEEEPAPVAPAPLLGLVAAPLLPLLEPDPLLSVPIRRT